MTQPIGGFDSLAIESSWVELGWVRPRLASAETRAQSAECNSCPTHKLTRRIFSHTFEKRPLTRARDFGPTSEKSSMRPNARQRSPMLQVEAHSSLGASYENSYRTLQRAVATTTHVALARRVRTTSADVVRILRNRRKIPNRLDSARLDVVANAQQHRTSQQTQRKQPSNSAAWEPKANCLGGRTINGYVTRSKREVAPHKRTRRTPANASDGFERLRTESKSRLNIRNRAKVRKALEQKAEKSSAKVGEDSALFHAIQWLPRCLASCPLCTQPPTSQSSPIHSPIHSRILRILRIFERQRQPERKPPTSGARFSPQRVALNHWIGFSRFSARATQQTNAQASAKGFEFERVLWLCSVEAPLRESSAVRIVSLAWAVVVRNWNWNWV